MLVAHRALGNDRRLVEVQGARRTAFLVLLLPQSQDVSSALKGALGLQSVLSYALLD